MTTADPEGSKAHCEVRFHGEEPIQSIPLVMPGLVPGIHVFLSCEAKTWMAGTGRP
jgi:hypothetical protein